MRTSRTLVLSAMLVITLLVLNSAAVSAEFWTCFTKGQAINFCNPLISDRTCSSTLCKYCMARYDSTNKCYSSGNWNLCIGLKGAQAQCSTGTGTIDTSAPVITLASPAENAIFTSRSIPFSLSVSEKSDVYFIDNINGRGIWSRVCTGCTSSSTMRSFKEGLNDITIRAKDVNNNYAYKSVKFFIDSKTPRINKLLPSRGFASGDFEIQFTEANPSSLILNYGNLEKGIKQKSLDISACTLDKGKYFCEITVPISNYDSQQIEYYFILSDIAGNSAESKHLSLSVDTTFPIINSLTYAQNLNRIFFVASITEQNFADISYIDNSALRPRWKKLCSRLINNICEKSITLSKGTHELTIQVNDKAGNSVGENIVVSV